MRYPLHCFRAKFRHKGPKYYINDMRSSGCLLQEIAEDTALLLSPLPVILALASLEKGLTEHTGFLEKKVINVIVVPGRPCIVLGLA